MAWHCHCWLRAFAMVLVSQGAFADTVSDFEALLPTAVNNFLLLDQNGRSGPAIPPGRTTSPFGALLEFSDPKKGAGTDLAFTLTTCTATHLIPGEARSVRSCLPASQQGGRAWIYLIYFDVTGRREFIRVDRFDPGADDTTITIPLPSVIVKAWSSVLSKEYPDPEDAWDDPEKSLPVTVWAYDSLALRPDIAKPLMAADGTIPFGLVFNPRVQCMASPNSPVVGIAKKDAAKKEVRKISLSMKDHPGPLLYIDSCNQAFIEGNQGALITKSADVSSPLGLYFNSLSVGNFWTRISKVTDPAVADAVTDPKSHVFYYHQVNGKVERFEPSHKASGANGLCAIGKMFPYLEGIFPGEDDEEAP